MSEKAEWFDVDWNKHPRPDRRDDYICFLQLVTPHGRIIATVQQFATSDHCFYANTTYDRSGCMASLDLAKQWCEVKTGNKVN